MFDSILRGQMQIGGFSYNGRFLNFSVEDPSCTTPSTWTHYGESCYKEIDTGLITRYNWADAQEACQLLNEDAHLVVVNSKEENDFIRGFGFRPVNEGIWLGCSDTVLEGQWTCLDGSGSTYDQTAGSGTGYWGWYNIITIFMNIH